MTAQASIIAIAEKITATSEENRAFLTGPSQCAKISVFSIHRRIETPPKDQ